MARGGRGGGRGGNRGRGFAQSAGVSHTFGGGKGGTNASKRSGGSSGQGVKDRGTFANGAKYKVRSPGGDQTVVPNALPGARVGPNLATERGRAKTAGYPKPNSRGRAAARGRGGSTQ